MYECVYMNFLVKDVSILLLKVEKILVFKREGYEYPHDGKKFLNFRVIKKRSIYSTNLFNFVF